MEWYVVMLRYPDDEKHYGVFRTAQFNADEAVQAAERFLFEQCINAEIIGAYRRETNMYDMV